VKRALAPDRTPAERRFQRRYIRLAVSIRTDDGKKLALGESTDVSVGGMRVSTPSELSIGDFGTAQITMPSGETVRANIDIVWADHGADGSSTYGVNFRELGSSERFALLEAIYAPSGGVFDEDAEAIGSVGQSTEPVTVAHHAYYMRLMRRIEKVHNLRPDITDRLLYARLHQGRPLREALLDFKVVDPNDLTAFLSSVYKVPFVDLSRQRPDPAAADAIPVGVATSQMIVPMKRTSTKLIVAMADPEDLPTLDLLQLKKKHDTEIQFALIEDIEKAINSIYHSTTLQSVDRLLESMPDSVQMEAYTGAQEVEDLETLRRLSDTTPIVTLVDSMLRSAVDDRASDVHVEPFGERVIVRFRLDGVLREVRTLPTQVYSAVTSRIKIMARMDITIRHVPQDGRASMRYNRKDFDLRVSSLPTVFGEKIVIRLLEKNPSFKRLKAVGFSDKNYELLAPLIHMPYGMLLACGPTGSGKSTTLFACLQEINDGETNITTIEDPVEYRVAGVNQVEVSVKRGLTFASVLRSLLRQDPDVIYVGEVRDRETADLAVRAALTGHLLLSTLHTNSAIQAIARLADIGVDPALVASSLLGIVGQRLMRRNCPRCSEEYETPVEEALVLQEMVPVAPPRKLVRGRGCEYCHETGFYGRMAVHEVVVIDEALRRLIAKGADSGQLLEYVSAQGFTELRDDAIGRMLAGETTLREVMRVTV